MLQNTKAVVIQSFKYGDSSLILHLYTELFGSISCIVKGARRTGKGSGKGVLLQLGNILDVSLNYQPQKNIQTLKDINAHYIPTSEKTNVLKHALVSFVCEVVYKCILDSEPTPELFYLIEHTIQSIHESDYQDLKLIPHYFCLQMCGQLGFSMDQNYTMESAYLNLMDGCFTNIYSNEGNCCSMQESGLIYGLITCELKGLAALQSNAMLRRDVLAKILVYLKIHLPEMKELRSVAVIQSLF
jgi:DNA repair protein RecO (recombination protein O)